MFGGSGVGVIVVGARVYGAVVKGACVAVFGVEEASVICGYCGRKAEAYGAKDVRASWR